MPFDPTLQEHADLFYEPIAGEEMPLIGDGVNYSRALGWQSPEGNFYGQERWVRDWPVAVVWDGEDYRNVEIDGEANSVAELPLPGQINPNTGLPYGPRQHFEMWALPRLNWPPSNIKVYDGRDKEFYYWDSVAQEWKYIEWLWSIDGEENLPRPGMGIGKAHILYYYDIKVMWNGYYWTRYKHSMIEDDEPWMHVPEGFMDGYGEYQTNTNGAILFLQSQQAEARLEFFSKISLGLLTSVPGKTGTLWVNNELLLTNDVTNVENGDPVIFYSGGNITTGNVDPSTEYYVYCGNSSFSACPSKLFISQTPAINGRLGDELPGLNARIVGVVETDSSGFFIREIDMSYIGRKVEFSQTFWEYSDFQLQFIDENNLAFNRIDGTHGLCYINGQLLYLSSGRDVNREDYRIEWGGGPYVDTDPILASRIYQVYICNDSYEFNFNNIDGSTGFPYEEGHPSYISALDFRRQLFLSTQPHDHRVFNQEYPGYYARHIGQVTTDENGYFRYSSNISLIRQPTLNPTHLDGLAECSFSIESVTQFKVYKKTGTTGLIYVGGKPVETYDRLDPLVHTINTSDVIYDYDEELPEDPLSESSLHISQLVGIPLHLYLANKTNPEGNPDSESVWGTLSKRMFISREEPIGGYLSANWPGNTARWIATFEIIPSDLGAELVTNGSFTGNTDWTLGSGWSYDEDRQLMYHTSGTAALSQSVSVSAGITLQVTFSLVELSVGSIAVSCGGSTSTSYSISGDHTFYLFCEDTSGLSLIPSSDFNGKIDNISVRQAISGNFMGPIFTNTVLGPEVTIIDDAILSNVNTWSSYKIQSELNNIMGKISASAGYTSEQQFGLSLRVEFFDSTRIKIYSTLSPGQDCTVIFPDLTSRDISTSGIYKTVTGSALTFYYIYLYENSVELSTNAPDITYEKLSVRGAGILIGYLGFSATNTLAGNWNVFSLYGEPERTWVTSVTTCGDTTLNLAGLVVAPNKTATASRSGWSAALLSTYCTYNTNQWGWLICTQQDASGSCTGTTSYNSETETYRRHASPENPGSSAWVNTGSSDHWSPGYGQPYMMQTAELNYHSFSQGTHAGQITLHHALNCYGVSSHGGYWHPAVDCYWQTCTGQITVIRQAGSW